MPKGSKTYVKPGWVAKQAKLTEYKKVRSKNIMEIDERCRALGVKHIANTVFGLGQTSRRKNGEGKRTLSEDDDNEEYRLPQGDFGLVSSDENTGDDGDDETSGYLANMAICVTHMIRGKRSRHACAVAAALAQATPAHPPVTRSSCAENTPEGRAKLHRLSLESHSLLMWIACQRWRPLLESVVLHRLAVLLAILTGF
ncbi:hypothetical protein MRB53_034916 [Persea americana]|uniref:Uncharacterized protein n=1 Tax=Persea americana TaxID=3435 RepID=A0ACC2K389_PERAE|nr:hypothetical protein MRB53_034916 [Persea americana]